MNASDLKREAARSLDAKLERVHGLMAKLVTLSAEITTDIYDDIQRFILKLIVKLEKERVRVDDEWNSPKSKLPFSTFADNWIENLKRLVSTIESGGPVTAANVRNLTTRQIGTLRNVTEKSVMNRFVDAPNFKNYIFNMLETDPTDLNTLGEEGDEELINDFLDKLFSEGVKYARPEAYIQQAAFWHILDGAIQGHHHVLVNKLLNDRRLLPSASFTLQLLSNTIERKQLDFFDMLMESRIGGIGRPALTGLKTQVIMFDSLTMDPAYAEAALRAIDRQYDLYPNRYQRLSRGGGRGGGRGTRKRRVTRR